MGEAVGDTSGEGVGDGEGCCAKKLERANRNNSDNTDRFRNIFALTGIYIQFSLGILAKFLAVAVEPIGQLGF